jgi:exosortase
MRYFIFNDRNFKDHQILRLLFLGSSLAGIIYSVSWLNILSRFLINGNTFAVLILVSIYMGTQTIWQKRHLLPNSRYVPQVQKYVGYSLILGGLVFFFAHLSHMWSQALGWSLILSGLAQQQWGLIFFKIHRQSVLLLSLSLYPGINIGAARLWTILTPPNLLEKMMAWTTSHILQAFGISLRLEGAWIYLTNTSIEISSGCNGLEMIFAIFWISLLLTHQQIPRKLWQLSLLGCLLALSFNIIRLTCLTIIVMSGDKSSFDFWHQSWGAQFFILPLFLSYYLISLKMGFLPHAKKHETIS